jgi:outer membrane protein TolC
MATENRNVSRMKWLCAWMILGPLTWICDALPAISAQEPSGLPLRISSGPAPVPVMTPVPDAVDKPLPINLPTALQLANVRPIDIAVASARIRIAAAQLDRARATWLPTILVGGDYYRHDGQIQSVQGDVFGTSKSNFMVGAGPFAVFAVTDAIFSPLAARQELRARQAGRQTAQNDSLLAVAEGYFSVQQARGELAGAQEAARRAEELVRRASELAPGLVPPVEAVRARTELARRRQGVQAARERWQTSSADLARILRLEPTALVDPLEPPHLRVTLVDLDRPLDELVTIGLTNRPELAAGQAVVQAALARLRQERLRPLIPSVLLRGASTNPAGTLAGGAFGGGLNGSITNTSARSDFDIQVLWEWENLGFGNRARVEERRGEKQLAIFELFRTQDRIAAEIVQAHAQARSAAQRFEEAEAGLKDAVDSVEKNFAGLSQTKRLGGEVILLVIRPQEVVAAVQALALAYNDYYGAVADFDRSQFRLYRALGHPAQALAGQGDGCGMDAAK